MSPRTAAVIFALVLLSAACIPGHSLTAPFQTVPSDTLAGLNKSGRVSAAVPEPPPAAFRATKGSSVQARENQQVCLQGWLGRTAQNLSVSTSAALQRVLAELFEHLRAASQRLPFGKAEGLQVSPQFARPPTHGPLAADSAAPSASGASPQQASRHIRGSSHFGQQQRYRSSIRQRLAGTWQRLQRVLRHHSTASYSPSRPVQVSLIPMASVALAVFLSGVVAGRLIERRQQRRRAGGGGSGHEAGEGEAAAAATAADGGAARPLTPPELQPHQPHHLRSMDRPHLHPLPHSDSFLQHAEPTTPTVRVQPATAAATSGTAQELTAVPQAAQLPQQPRQQRRWRLLGLIPMGRGGRDSSEEQGAAAPNGSYADSGGGSGGGGGGGGTITGTDTSTVSTGRTPAAGGPPVTPPHPHMAHAVPAAGTPFAPTTSAHAPSLPCPSPKPSGAPSSAAASATPATAVTAAAPDAATHLEHPRHVWYVNEQDLQYFRLRAEQVRRVCTAGLGAAASGTSVGTWEAQGDRRTLGRGALDTSPN